jgi:hypothetical protein
LGRLSSSGSRGKKKVDLSFSEQLLRVVFSTFCGQKINLKFLKKYCSVHLKKLHKIKFKFKKKSLKNRITTQVLILSVIQRGALTVYSTGLFTLGCKVKESDLDWSF